MFTKKQMESAKANIILSHKEIQEIYFRTKSSDYFLIQRLRLAIFDGYLTALWTKIRRSKAKESTDQLNKVEEMQAMIVEIEELIAVDIMQASINKALKYKLSAAMLELSRIKEENEELKKNIG